MPTTRTGKGGKNWNRGKNEADNEKRELIFKKDGQEYAQVLRMLGNGRCEAMCIDGTKRICHIRGKVHKKLWIAVGDIILVGLRDHQDDKAVVILKYVPDEARLLKAYGELPESSRLNEGIAGGLDEEDEGAGETLFERNPSEIKTSELLPQAQIKEMKKKGNDSPPSKKQKKNKDSSTSIATPEIDDNPAVAAETTMLEVEIEALPVEAEVRPDSESYFINEAGNLEIPPDHDISLRDDPFNKFGLEMSQYIHSQNDADYYASLLLPKFMKHFHNQVVIVDRMASHLGQSINKVLLQKEGLENNIKKFDFAKNGALKRISLLQEEVATIEAARNKAIANALAETKELLAASTVSVSDRGHIAETTELEVEIAELKKQLVESRASQAFTSTKLSPEGILKPFEGNVSSLLAKKQNENKVSSSTVRNTLLADKKQVVIESSSLTLEIDDDPALDAETTMLEAETEAPAVEAEVRLDLDKDATLTEKNAKIAELKDLDKDAALTEKDAKIAELKKQLEHKTSSSQELTVEEQFERLKGTTPYSIEMVRFLKQGFEMFRQAAIRHLKDPASKDLVHQLEFYASHDEYYASHDEDVTDDDE